jgi:CheY-like chemotaxis protein
MTSLQDSSSNKPAILIVDDEPLARMELGEVVRQCGLTVWEVANTAEALSILEKAADHFTGLITDINMPGMRSGVVLANHVHSLWPHISIIVVSAAREPLAGELPDHVSFLSKPLPPSKLIATLQPSLSGTAG